MAKRIAQNSVNWTALAERVPAEQRTQLTGFRAKSDGYLRRVLANPPEPPKINWAAYKQAVPIPGMVDSFQKQYEALKIPYPEDKYTAKVDAQWSEIKKSIDKFISESNANIAKCEKKVADVKALLPFEAMTMEDYKDAYPDLALDPLNRPTFWPHNPEEQVGYVNPDQPAHQEHH